jgi:hypothetical protein
MAIKPQVATEGNIVEKHINTAFDTVSIVADNIDDVLATGSNIISINLVGSSINSVNTIVNNLVNIDIVADDITNGNINAAIAAAISTALDVIATNANVVSTTADAISTAADVVLTNADVVTTDTNATNASTSASNAQTAQGLSEDARDASIVAKGLSEVARDKSQDWAEELEDTEVETGKYSALHHAAKAEAALSVVVHKTSNIGSAELPSGTTAQRDGAPVGGYVRYNSTTGKYEGYFPSLTLWAELGGGQLYGNSAVKSIFYNAQSIGEDIIIEAANNAMSAGPISINTGFSVTVETGARWVIN